MSTNQVVVQLGPVANECFVVMPFDPTYDQVYARVIKPAIEAAGLDCVRGDEVYAPNTIVENIWRSIRGARLVVAELSGRNPNVMYEIGLAHAIGKPIILVTRNQDDVPVDLRSVRYIYYDLNDPFWGENLRTTLATTATHVLAATDAPGYLSGLSVKVDLPDLPPKPTPEAEPTTVTGDFGGTWTATWFAVPSKREHHATLVIPESHGPSFSAVMTVVFVRDGQPTIVEERMAGAVDGPHLALTGVNLTYVRRGNSVSYGFDTFDLTLSDDGLSMLGTVNLSRGDRRVAFQRVPKLPSDVDAPDDQPEQTSDVVA